MSVKLQQYTVKAGDTLSGIAERHDTISELLRDWNRYLTSEFVDENRKRDENGNWIYHGDSVTIVTPDQHQRLIEGAKKMKNTFDPLSMYLIRNFIGTWKPWRDSKASGKL